MYPHGNIALSELISMLPPLMGYFVGNVLVSKATIVLSNVPGPKEPMVFGGSKTTDLFALIPGIGDLAFGISAISHCDTLRMAIQADLTYLENP